MKAEEFLKNISGRIAIFFHNDSITGDSEIIVNKDNHLKLTTIEMLYDELKQEYKEIKRADGKKILIPKNMKIFSIKNGKTELVKIKSLVKHKTNKRMFEIKSKMGKINLTEDHSIMTLKKCKFVPEKPENIKYIASPIKYKFGTRNMSVDILENKDYFNNLILTGNFNSKIYDKVSKKANTSKIQLKKHGLPIWHLEKDEIKKIRKNIKSLRIRQKGPTIPINIKIDKDFMNFFGLWVADGCSAKGKKSELIKISSYQDIECKKIIDNIANRFKCSVYVSDEGVTANLTSNIIFNLMNFLEFRGKAMTKRVPKWVFGLKEELMASFLSGYFSGDGTVSKGDINASSISYDLLKDMQTLLLFFGIRSYIRMDKSKTGYQSKNEISWKLSINHSQYKRIFINKIRFLQDRKNKKIKLSERSPSLNMIPLELEIKEKIKGRYNRNRNFSKQYLQKLIKFQDDNIKSLLKEAINLDVHWEIPQMRNLGKKNLDVYDIETETGNFIANNIVLKNSDGVCSAAMMLKFVKEADLFSGDVHSDIAKGFAEKYDSIIFVDYPVDQYLDYMETIKHKKVLVIDHHPITNDLNKIGIVHINPRFKDPNIYRCASQEVYDILTNLGVEDIEWIMKVGAAGDKAIEGTKKEQEAALTIDAFKTFRRAQKLPKLVKFILECDDVDDLIYSEYRDLKLKLDEEVKNEIIRFEMKGLDEINIYEVQSKHGILAILSNTLFDKYPDKTFILYRERDGNYKFSGRSRNYDLGEIFRKASEGIGGGGGHPQAAGAYTRSLNIFLKRLEELLI